METFTGVMNELTSFSPTVWIILVLGVITG